MFTVCEEKEYCNGNYHIFYLLFHNQNDLLKIKNKLKNNKILATTHYVPLHTSEFYNKNYNSINLSNCESISQRLLRLPLYNDLTFNDVIEKFGLEKLNFSELENNRMNVINNLS